MTDRPHLSQHLAAALAGADARTEPYRYWLLSDTLPDDTARAIVELPVDVPAIGDTAGKRETHNSMRVFFSAENRMRYPVCEDVASVFQDKATVAALQRRTGADLTGALLRIEYCQDTDGFWLERHTDIGAKLFTMLVYLSTSPDAKAWGTDVYDGEGRHLGAAPGDFNKGLIFVPGSDTWHGFERRRIDGVRKSIIINYVTHEWRSRHELAFPNEPVAA